MEAICEDRGGQAGRSADGPVVRTSHLAGFGRINTAVFAAIALAALGVAPSSRAGEASEFVVIKAYCLDFNWAGRRGFAKPGTWKDADPAAHVAWYKAMGANVIQTFCVSCNGHAWYKNGVVPEQPGLKHDFLREVVKLGHAEGMLVMGYFCIASNTRWGKEHPDLSYGTPSTYHIPHTDEYLAYLRPMKCPGTHAARRPKTAF